MSAAKRLSRLLDLGFTESEVWSIKFPIRYVSCCGHVILGLSGLSSGGASTLARNTYKYWNQMAKWLKGSASL